MSCSDHIEDPGSKAYVDSLPSRQARYKDWRRTKKTPCPILTWCTGCNHYLPVTSFYLLEPGSIQGRKTILKEKRHSLCSGCHSASYQKDHDRKRLLSSARRRAKDKGIEFSITDEDIVIPEKCPALGLALRSGRGITGSDCSPSLDRIDNSRGYVKGNVAIISFRANTLKNSATARELKLIADYVENRLKVIADSGLEGLAE